MVRKWSLFVLLWSWMLAGLSAQVDVSHISYEVEEVVNGQTFTVQVIHAVYHDLVVETFDGEGFEGVMGQRFALGDGHAAVWVNLVTQGSTSWIRESGWLLSNGDFVADETKRKLVPIVDVLGTDLGDFYRWISGEYYTAQREQVADIQQLGLSNLQTYYNRSHPGLRKPFVVEQKLYTTTVPSDGSVTQVVVYEFYKPAGANPDLLRLRRGAYRITGWVWSDDNRNGLLDDGEPTISGVWLRLIDNTGAVVDISYSNTIDGSYGFDINEPGSYRVEVDQPLDTRTSRFTPPGDDDTLGSAFTGHQTHNNPAKTAQWEVTATTPMVSVSDEDAVAVLNCGLTPLPVVSFYPPIIVATEPAPGRMIHIPITVQIDRLWDQVSLIFDFIPVSDGMHYPTDFGMMPGTILSTNLFDLKKNHVVTVNGDADIEGTETMLVRYDLRNNPEISSRSTGLTIVIHEEEPPPPQLLPLFSELYAGTIGGDDGSPAVAFRQAGEYRFGGYIAETGDAFFADMEMTTNNGFAMDTPAGRATGVFTGPLIEGLFTDSTIRFSLRQVPPLGAFSNAAGLYTKSGIGGADWDIYAVLTPQGKLLFYSEFDGDPAGGAFTLNGDGQFDLRIDSSRVRGTVRNFPPYEIIAVLEEPGFSADLRLQRVSTFEPQSDGPLAFMLNGAQINSDGWNRQTWFGFFRITDLGQRWVFHNHWGWVWVSAQNFQSFWFYSLRFDEYFWATPTSYPALYSAKSGSWFHFLPYKGGYNLFDHANNRWR